MKKRQATGRRRAPRFGAGQLLVTCEHASNRVPAGYGGLGLGKQALARHIAWDLGAASVARAIAAGIGCPLHLAPRCSRP